MSVWIRKKFFKLMEPEGVGRRKIMVAVEKASRRLTKPWAS